jgi:hypothetical protein
MKTRFGSMAAYYPQYRLAQKESHPQISFGAAKRDIFALRAPDGQVYSQLGEEGPASVVSPFQRYSKLSYLA